MSMPPPGPPPGPPPNYPQYPQGGYGGMPQSNDQRGFFAALFDFSFQSFVTVKFVKFIYALLMVLVGLGTLAVIVSAFDNDSTLGIVTLIFSPVIAILWLVFVRMWLEMIVVMFRISEDMNAMRRHSGA